MTTNPYAQGPPVVEAFERAAPQAPDDSLRTGSGKIHAPT